jgi:hypothetical protein
MRGSMTACGGGEIVLIPNKKKYVWIVEMENEGIVSVHKTKDSANIGVREHKVQWPRDEFKIAKMEIFNYE